MARSSLHDNKMYRAWAAMKTQCTNPKYNGTENYMAKGITYDPNWHSFSGFAADMGETYIDGYSLERLDNAKGYSKSNCCWIPRSRQARNKTRYRSNSSGMNGTHWDTKHGAALYAVCHWYGLDGKKYQKSFSVIRHGLLPAFAMACAYRNGMIEQLNSQGAGYSDNHGKQ